MGQNQLFYGLGGTLVMNIPGRKMLNRSGIGKKQDGVYDGTDVEKRYRKGVFDRVRCRI